MGQGSNVAIIHNNSSIHYEYCYIVGLGPNCKFIDLLFKRLVITFIKISFLNLFHCFRNYLQSDRHTHRRTDVLEIILIRNLLMVKHTVVIASVTACSTKCSRFDLLSISIDFNVKITVILK